MKAMSRWMLALLLVVGLPLVALAEEEEDKATHAAAEIGYWDASVDGSPDVAAEYEPVEGGPEVRVKVDTVKDGGSILFYGKYRDKADQDYVLNFDARRTFRSKNTLNTLLHRLGHQPLDHFESATKGDRARGRHPLAGMTTSQPCPLPMASAPALPQTFLHFEDARAPADHFQR